MLFELVIFTAWMCGSTLLIIGGFFFLRWIVRKIDEFFDRHL